MPQEGLQSSRNVTGLTPCSTGCDSSRNCTRRSGLPDFGLCELPMRQYLDSLRGYQKNRFTELSKALAERINIDWALCFDAWGYARHRSGPQSGETIRNWRAPGPSRGG